VEKSTKVFLFQFFFFIKYFVFQNLSCLAVLELETPPLIKCLPAFDV